MAETSLGEVPFPVNSNTGAALLDASGVWLRAADVCSQSKFSFANSERNCPRFHSNTRKAAPNNHKRRPSALRHTVRIGTTKGGFKVTNSWQFGKLNKR